MREIVFDTETTGLSFQGGDRLVEIGCVELVNRYPTGREYHVFINPERDVPAEAEAVHGILVNGGTGFTGRDSTPEALEPLLDKAMPGFGEMFRALSFDEIIVTTFTAGAQQQTLPIWIFNNLFRPNQAPVVNVVAAVLVIVSIVPIYLAQRLSAGNEEGMTAAR